MKGKSDREIAEIAERARQRRLEDARRERDRYIEHERAAAGQLAMQWDAPPPDDTTQPQPASPPPQAGEDDPYMLAECEEVALYSRWWAEALIEEERDTQRCPTCAQPLPPWLSTSTGVCDTM